VARDLVELNALFSSNLSAARGLTAAYQALLGGVPTADGYFYLIETARSSNFGSGRADVTFNDENVFINLTNNLVRGNDDAAARFEALTGGATTLAGQIEALYKAFVPTDAQTADGLAYLIRPEALTFYAKVAEERGVAGDDGAAIVALASLLKILVDHDQFDLGDDVNDFLAAVADGTAKLGTSGFTDVDIADGDAHDGDERDIVAPSVEITAATTLLRPGGSTTVTFDFSEAVKGFTLDDVQATGGTLSNLVQSSDDPSLYTATFTAGATPGTAGLTLSGAYTDIAGNAGSGDSVALTVRPGSGTNPSNDTPVAVGDAYALDEDTVLSIAGPGVLGNDSDANGDALTAVLVSDVAHGTLVLNADGSFDYTPDANFVGTDSFTYKANDGRVGGNTVTVDLTVNSINDGVPVAAPDAYTVNEDGKLSGAAPGVLANDTDIDGDPLTAVLVTGPANGTLTLKADGSFDYIPDADFNGTDSFTYAANDGTANGNTVTVDLTVTAVNDAPAAVADTYSVNEDDKLSVAGPGVLANDTDIDGDPLTAALVTGPANGTLTLNADGSFDYTPDTDFNGADSFTYKANDGTLDGNTVTVNLTVNPVNDAPVAGDDVYSVNEDTKLSIAAPGILNNDTDLDGDTLTVTLVDGPDHGTLTLNGDGSFDYIPDANFDGTDSFTYMASDGSANSSIATVDLTVIAVNDGPTGVADTYSVSEDGMLGVGLPGVLSNDIDQDGDTLTAVLVSDVTNGTLTLNANGGFSYAPNANFNGTDSFVYQASDGTTLSAPVTVTLNVAAINDAPTANADSYTTGEDTPLTVAGPGVLGNDTDIDGNALSAVLVGGPASGTLTLNPDGSFLYTPNGNFNGTDSFTYQVSDGVTLSSPVTVTLNVTPANDAPVGNTDSYVTGEDTPLTVAAAGVLANDTDLDGDALTAVLVSGPASGTLALNANGSFTYTPTANFNGTDSFVYRASDGAALSAPVTVNLTVTAVNDAPQTAPENFNLFEDTPLTVAAPGVLTNDSDVEGNPLTAVLVTGPTNGMLTLNANGSFTYTPNLNFNGVDGFTYRTNDGSANGNNATVQLIVSAVNDAPVTVADGYAVDQNTTLTVLVPNGLLANDTDVDGNALTAALAAGPANGTLVLNTNGSFEYTPDAGFTGADSFTYRANDGTTLGNLATVTLTVSAALDPVMRLTPGANNLVSNPSISADGLKVVAYSSATNITSPDTNASQDIFLYDVTTKAFTNITAAANGNSVTPKISGDGSTVIFHSFATNLDEAGTNGTNSDVIMYDVATKVFTNITAIGNAGSISNNGDLSADGSLVVFASTASNLSATDTNGAVRDVFLYDVDANVFTNITQGGDTNSAAPRIAADGSAVVFTSGAVLTAGDPAGTFDAFRYDVTTKTLNNITQGQNGGAYETVISGDGMTVAFVSDSTNLTAGDTNARNDVFLYNVATDTITNITGYSSTGSVGNIAMSADGKSISFWSDATDLTAGDTNGKQDVFVYDVTSATMRNVTQGGNNISAGSALSADGSSIALISQANNLTSDPTPAGFGELFLFQI